MNPPSLHRTAVSPRLVAVLGAVCAVAIALAAAVDLGRPLQAARAEAERGAAARAEAVELSWERLLTAASPPAPAHGLSSLSGPPTPPFRAPLAADKGPDSAPADTTFNALLDAGRVAAAQGALLEAEELVADALARAEDRESTSVPRLAEARLAAVRIAGALGNDDAARKHRRVLLEGHRGAALDGTSVALLACLVKPADPAAAAELLLEEGAALPTPDDRARIRAGALALRPDPWWSAIEARLTSLAPDRDWSVALQESAREQSALLALADDLGLEPSAERWQFAPVGDTLIAYRGDQDQLRIGAVQPGELLERLEETLSIEPPFHLALDGESALGERLFGPGALSGSPLQFSITHDDPEARGRKELARQRLLRAALLGLALLVLGTALLAARALARARRLAELRSTFVASVSHDLRTPTQAILLLAETLEENRLAPPTAGNRRRYHVRIRKEAQRLRRQIEDLLDSARIDRGEGARIERREVDLAAFFDELEQAMSERAEAVGAHLTVRRERLPRGADLDPDGVRRAIWNLFENALQHGRREDRDAGVRVEVEVAAMGDALSVTVDDDGPGIPARYAESAFAPFERLVDRGAHAADIATDTGTGLGLAIVRALARAHGGDAEVLPKSDGARMRVTFRYEPDAFGPEGDAA